MWKDLNLRNKSEIIKLAVKSGITDLRNIQKVYKEYAEGGHVYDGNTENTQLLERTDNTRVSYNPQRNNLALDTTIKSKTNPKDYDISDNPLGWMPVIGDALQAGQVGIDLYNNNYEKAVLGTGLLLLPNFLEKPIKKVIKHISPNLLKHKFEIDLNDPHGQGLATYLKDYKDRILNGNAVTSEELNIINDVSHNTIKKSKVDPITFGDTEYDGWYYKDKHNNHIIETSDKLKGIQEGSTIVHELSHARRGQLSDLNQTFNTHTVGLSNQDVNILSIPYGNPIFKKHFKADFPGLSFAKELTASNSEMRYKLIREFKRRYGKYPSGTDLDYFIDNLSLADTRGLLRDTNAYTSNIVQTAYNNLSGVQFDLWLQKVKKPLKEVAGVAVPVGTTLALNANKSEKNKK